jgi:dihydroneopterin aldolase
MADLIILEGLEIFGYHGVLPEEQRLGQRFVVDLWLSLDLEPAGRADDVGLSVDYGEAFREVEAIVGGPSHSTLEAVAEAVTAALLARFANLRSVRARVSKPGAPISNARFRNVAVEIERSREAPHD